MTTAPRDLSQAEGNCGRMDEHGPCPRRALRSGSSAVLSTAVPSTAPKATRGHRDAEQGLVAPSHSFRCWKGEVKQDPVLPQRCPQCCPCLQGGKKAQETILGGRGVPGTLGLVIAGKGLLAPAKVVRQRPWDRMARR